MYNRFTLSAMVLFALALLLFPGAAISREAATGIAPANGDRYATGLLWKIRSGDTSSYIFGTMHSEHPDVMQLPGPVSDAFSQSKQLVLELVLDRATIRQLAAATRITEGADLPALLGARLYGRVSEVMAGYDIPSHALRDMKPWAVATTLLNPRTNTGLFLDRVLYLEALAKAKPVIGLETADEQMAAFESMSMDVQVALLRDTLELVPELDSLYVEMRELYIARDLAGLVKLNDGMLERSDPELAEVFMSKIVTERNHRMAERLEPYLKGRDMFIAIGALHLPGDEGLLNLLAQRGYEIEVVY